MFGISIPELIIVFVVILLVFGPDRLPEIARKMGKMMADIKRTSDGARKEFYNNIYRPTDEADLRLSDASREMRAIKSELEGGLKNLSSPLPEKKEELK